MNNQFLGYSLFDFIGNVGVYGDITFTVGSISSLSPTLGTSVSKGHENTKHEVIGSADLTEFKKRKLRTVTIQIKAIEGLNSVKQIVNSLTRISENGEHYPLIIGSEAFADNDFIVSNFEEGIQRTDFKGDSTFSTLSVTFEEYISIISRGEKYSETIYMSKVEEVDELELLAKNEGTYDELEVLFWLQ